MNSLIEEAKAIMQRNSETQQLEKKLEKKIFDTFINVPFETKMFDSKWWGKDWIYFPIPNSPEGYVIKNETIIRTSWEDVKGSYDLIDSNGEKITVKFYSDAISDEIFINENTKAILKKGYYPSDVVYAIDISGSKYEFSRIFSYDEILYKILSNPLKLNKDLGRIGDKIDATQKCKINLSIITSTDSLKGINAIFEQKEGGIYQITNKYWTKVNSRTSSFYGMDYLYYENDDLFVKTLVPFNLSSVKLELITSSKPLKLSRAKKVTDMSYEWCEPSREIVDNITLDQILSYY